MKKITLMVLVLLGTMFSSVEASDLAVPSEKIWTIKLNEYVLDTTENLQNVQIVKEDGEVVPANVEVNDKNAKVIEVYPLTNFLTGKYKIIINEGLQSFDGVKLEKAVIKDFVVDHKLTLSAVNGSWTTYYDYKKTPYKVNVTFKDGQAKIIVADILSGNTFTSTKTYTLENGFMHMAVGELNLNLSGDILVYSNNEFKLLTKGGSFSYFHKQ